MYKPKYFVALFFMAAVFIILASFTIISFLAPKVAVFLKLGELGVKSIFYSKGTLLFLDIVSMALSIFFYKKIQDERANSLFNNHHELLSQDINRDSFSSADLQSNRRYSEGLQNMVLENAPIERDKNLNIQN